MASLVVFARLPVPGKVKTRLAAGIGPEGACEFYRACAEHVLRESSRCEDTRRVVFFSDESERTDVEKWVEKVDKEMEVACQAQVSDLGERMSAALGEVLNQGASKAVIIGTDIPDLNADLIQKALRVLDANDVVLGPAADGGYYLLGLKKVHTEIFKGVRWSTSDVLQSTVDNAAAAGIRVAPVDTLPTLRDIDTVEDLREWHSNQAAATHALYETVRSVLNA
mmetsp:Transcript_14809/g.31820  ORF Transcript_14809/g.31820 Transcript_14809/m.31820 type:complete len:224 (+) Transcript_14809:46-717(+)